MSREVENLGGYGEGMRGREVMEELGKEGEGLGGDMGNGIGRWGEVRKGG